MRTITPTDYQRLTPIERLALDSWLEQEGLGPANRIHELRVWDDGTVVVERYRAAQVDWSTETIVHECAQALPV